jgi:hypothetical protein
MCARPLARPSTPTVAARVPWQWIGWSIEASKNAFLHHRSANVDTIYRRCSSCSCHALTLCLQLLRAQRHIGGTSLQSQQTALLHWKSSLWGPELTPSPDELLGTPHQPLQLGRHRVLQCCCTPREHYHAVARGQRISLPGADIHGRLGDLNFSALPFLTYIDLNSNSLHGTIPPNIVPSLPRLSYLNLDSNWLTGPIPNEIGDLESLTRLDLSNNNLRGHIPASLGNMTHLSLLSLHHNELSGPIPHQLGSLQSLSQLSLSFNNNLTGQIMPISLGNLTRLTLLYLDRC